MFLSSDRRLNIKIFSNLKVHNEVALLGGALCFELDGREFDFQRRHGIFLLISPSSSNYGPGVDEASNRNDYNESSWGMKRGRLV
jgi:hypothetical protein